ncbi:hypothetical protein BDY19DRAFT_996589 [Irpex rosettiformis]|uniref:Uncharacterized protein n=1 Tax=Irpex rosettiformis TaxID=378272 RepID=A0ACB8TUT1_9APHY|nr:hypothetical protein BDY19DRAFT_996589 [Irpex rosettiformis]
MSSPQDRRVPPPIYSSAPTVALKAGSTHASEIWMQVEPGKYVSQKIQRLDPTNSDLHEGRVPRAWYDRAQRALKTVMLVGIVMACVSAQIMGFVMTTLPSLEHTMAICFAALALFFTTLSAMYSGITYIWLRLEWTPHATKFDEWVSSSTSIMIVWSGTGLVIGVYSGFLATICFVFAVMHHTLATICTCIFVAASITPMIWGLYRWQGLYTHSLVWKPRPNGPTLVSARKADQLDYV